MNRIQLFAADASLPIDPYILNLFRSWLSSDEIERYFAFRKAADARTFLVSRGIMRSVLAQHTGRSPEKLHWNLGIYGKPYLSDYENLDFNLSHSASHVAFAVAWNAEIGLDIECYKGTGIIPEDIAVHCFSPEELRNWQSLCKDESEMMRSFFIRWVLKESYMKAQGLGLNLPADCFSFIFEKNGCFKFQSDLMNKNKQWTFFLYDQHKDYPLALSVFQKSDFPHPESALEPISWEWTRSNPFLSMY